MYQPMLPEFGLLAMILALLVAATQAVVPLLGLRFCFNSLIKLACPLSLMQALLITLSLVCLACSFINNDFSVVYIAKNSNSQLIWPYRLAAIWGAHEGSLLLWAWLLSLWGAAVAISGYKRLPEPLLAAILAILGIVAAGFMLFLLHTSNPFLRFLPEFPLDGQDLNPLLQDLGLILHPPILYMGYVGLAVPFAVALASLLKGELTQHLVAWLRPWVLCAWAFLTLGITLGSWWAYYELGWGGWWFWDPVENASFMPWLVATALLHCLIIAEKRAAFYSWSIFLAIGGFAFSLLGTFLVRSGVLTSVHAFAADPARGIFILQYILVVIGGGLLLYAVRAKTMLTSIGFNIISREGSLLINNLLLITATGTILIGTLYPLIYDFMFHDKISVGYPYFNAVFVPLMIPLLMLMACSPFGNWGQDSLTAWLNKTKIIYVPAIVAALLMVFWVTPKFDLALFGGLALSFALIISVIILIITKPSGSIPNSIGMWLAHLGVACALLGIVCSKTFEIEHDLRLRPGEQVTINSFTAKFTKLELLEGSNYVSYQGTFAIYNNNGQLQTILRPEKRVFVVSNLAMAETAISPGLWYDIYIALGEQLDANSWSVRVYYKPMVRWIWLGGLLMALGGVVAVWQRHRLNYEFRNFGN